MSKPSYSDLYIDDAQYNLGHAFDFAINSCGIEADAFMALFVVSGIASQLEKGNPKYICGMSGCELVRHIAAKVNYALPDIEDVMYPDRSDAFWAGWSLAYYQWHSGRTFRQIQETMPVSKVISMYYPLHEADISKFVRVMEKHLCFDDTELARLRRLRAYSQRALALRSGVNIRQIQLFEQRKRDIRKAQAETVQALATALDCTMEELLA